MKIYLVITFIAGMCTSASMLRDKTFVLQQPDGTYKKLLMVAGPKKNQGDAECVIFTDNQLMEKVQKESENHEIPKLSDEQMEQLLQECSPSSIRGRRHAFRISQENITENIIVSGEAAMEALRDVMVSRESIIYPGTKWCGPTTLSQVTDYDVLGFHRETDMCCREHTYCNDTIQAGETKHNLTNNSTVIRNSCQCEKVFYDCLSSLDSVASNTIGFMHFNKFSQPCFKKNYPKTEKCVKYWTWFKVKCRIWERAKTTKPIYEWYNFKKYKRIPITRNIIFSYPSE